MGFKHASRLLIAALAVGPLSCGGSSTAGGEVCAHFCARASFGVVVPEDRAGDVAAMTATGPCEPTRLLPSQPGVYSFDVEGAGVCRITVSFKSGAPDFVGNMKLLPNSGPCCPTVPSAETTFIAVPELADASTHK